MRGLWFGSVVCFTVVDAWLIAKPNLLGKLGLMIYRYDYLRTFPRALVTVASVVGVVWLGTEFLVWLRKRGVVSLNTVVVVLILMMLFFVFALIKTAFDFQSWSYSHAGTKLKYGAYLLPVLLTVIAGSGVFRARRQRVRNPASTLNEKPV